MQTTTRRARAAAVAALAAAAIAPTLGPGAVAARPAAPSAPPPAGADALVSYSVLEDEGPVVHRGGTTTPFTAGAIPTKIVSGQFDADPGGEAILYSYGTAAPDGLLQIDASGSGVTTTEAPLQIGGAFQPVVGDFDGNGIDDVLWYAPGTARDYLWTFDAAGAHTSRRVQVDGAYRPSALDADGDGRTDVLWYGPGSRPDRLWLMGPGAVPTTKALTIGGDYQVVVGPFGQAGAGQPTDRVVFFNPKGSDWLWTFDTGGTPTSHALPTIDGAYTVLGGQFIEEAYGTLLFYGPGTLPERLWAFGPPPADVAEQEAPPQVTGTYRPVTGDFDGNDLTDIAWVGDKGPSRLWSFRFDGTVVGTPLPLPYRPWWTTATVPLG